MMNNFSFSMIKLKVLMN